MRILGISAYYHDSAACICIDGKPVAAAQEERFTRKKHDPGFPFQAIKYCLDYTGLCLDDLDAVVYYEKPFLKFERLLETYYHVAPRGFVSFAKSIPVWTREKLFLKDNLRKSLAQVMPYDKRKLKLLFTDHHLSHAASAFYPSPYDEAAILTLDGVGEWTTAAIAKGNKNGISLLKEMHYPDSVGLLYSAFTWFLGFMVNSGEYKLMGLAPYGNANDPQTKAFSDSIRNNIVRIFPDGSVSLNQRFFSYSTRLRMIREKQWHKLFGFGRRKAEDKIEQHHCNLALAIQQITEEIVLLMAREAQRLSQSDNLVMAGGVALNCVANSKIREAGLFKNIFVQPASGDAGGALGAALAAEYIYFGNSRNAVLPDGMEGAFLGPDFTDLQVESVLKKYGAVYKQYSDFDTLTSDTAAFIEQGKVVGWFQGRMEFGPRALGNRSFVADPRNIEMQKQLNLKVKFREGFRPFAPAVLAEDCEDYFDISTGSPYMLMVAQVKPAWLLPLPGDYETLGYMEKLYTRRSVLQAITHCDFSARLQTVHAETNPEFHTLISAFKKRTGCSVLVNTSFNVRGEPIVCTPDDAFRCFMRSSTDVLVMNKYLIMKEEVAHLKKMLNFDQEFKAD